MKKNLFQAGKLGKLISSALVFSTFSALGMSAAAAEESPSIIGSNEWLFYRYEMTDANDTQATNASLQLIERLHQVLARNGVTLAVAMVPLKMRIYSDQLPASVKINPFMANNYARMASILQTAQVPQFDLNTAFMNSSKRAGETPLFIRLDTHWSPSGAMQAAEAIKAGIDADPALKNVLAGTPETKYTMAWDKRKVNSKSRDLVEQLPKGSAPFGGEQLQAFRVTKDPASGGGLLGDSAGGGVTLMGSSYSNDWTGFPDALRYNLQRDVLRVSVGADQGSWMGMESYLRDDAFQTRKPKLIIWEMPERDMRAPPNYKYRDARYISDNSEWLLRAAALTQGSCKPSGLTAKLEAGGLAAGKAVTGTDFSTEATAEADFIELSFDKPLEKLDYLSARVTSAGSKTVSVEGSGPGVATRRFAMQVAGDEAAHNFKAALPSNGKGYTKLRIFPGKSRSFAMKELQVCRQPDDLLK